MKTCLMALLGMLATPAMAQVGIWDDPFDFGDANAELDPIAPVHLIHLHTGKILAITYAGDDQPCDPNCMTNCVARVYLWTPSSAPGDPGTFEDMHHCRINLFCAGHSALADGRILTVGGDLSTPQPFADRFESLLEVWNFGGPPSNMAQARYYPTATTLSDGRILATSGSRPNPAPPPSTIIVGIPEVYDPIADSWTQLHYAEYPNAQEEPTYPYMFVLPDGNVVKAGAGGSRILKIGGPTDPSWGPFLPAPIWQPEPPPDPPGWEGSAVMYEPGKVMKCGGLGTGNVGVKTTWVVNLNGADPDDPPAWLSAGDLNRRRVHHNLVILPDGKVLAVGGNERLDSEGTPLDPVFHRWTSRLRRRQLHPDSSNLQAALSPW